SSCSRYSEKIKQTKRNCFLAALILICFSFWDTCFLYHCSGSELLSSPFSPGIIHC
uniref:Uncharacterized protein n=1 Tax=Anolis carolinensis TaxID=28377 RepID=A0A803TIT7_ANOCA